MNTPLCPHCGQPVKDIAKTTLVAHLRNKVERGKANVKEAEDAEDKECYPGKQLGTRQTLLAKYIAWLDVVKPKEKIDA